jgi:hypothetical protein
VCEEVAICYQLVATRRPKAVLEVGVVSLLKRTSPTCAGVENVNKFNTIDREVVSNRL